MLKVANISIAKVDIIHKDYINKHSVVHIITEDGNAIQIQVLYGI